MRRNVPWQNIARYRQLLKMETDARRREAIMKLLAEEESIWVGLIDEEESDKSDRK